MIVIQVIYYNWLSVLYVRLIINCQIPTIAQDSVTVFSSLIFVLRGGFIIKIH